MTTKTFFPRVASNGTYTGFTTNFVVPAQVTSIEVTLQGAGTGNSSNTDYVTGGLVTGTLAVTPGETLQLNLGDSGALPSTGTGSAQGGYNEGGNGRSTSSGSGGGGAGATDIRQGGTTNADRVAVAGGAGGCSGGSFDFGGGVGGADTGGNGGAGTGGGHGGSQVAGGAAGPGSLPGDLNLGGSAGGVVTVPAGGGGSGYYGGGAGGNGTQPAGGGGSNYIGGLTSATSTAGAVMAGQFQLPAQAPPGRPIGANLIAPLITLVYNDPPNAPTSLGPVPLTGSNFDAAIAIDLFAQFNDPDPGDTPSRGDLRYRVGGGAWTETDNVFAFPGGARGVGIVSVAGGTFTADIGQPVEWQCRFWDAAGAFSPWSASGYIIPCAAPDPFVFDPAPTNITSNGPTVLGDRASAGLIAAYEIELVGDVAGAPTGTIYIHTSQTDLDTPSATLAVTLPDAVPDLTDSDSYHILVKIAYPLGVWQPNWTDSGPLVAAIESPFAPTALVEAIVASASGRIVITNPNTGTDPHPPAYNNVYRTDMSTGIETRIGTGVPVNGTFVDLNPGFHSVYRYRITSVFVDSDGIPHEASSE